MEEHRADKRRGETNEIPDGHEAVSCEFVGGVEILKTEPKDDDTWVCDECGDEFASERAKAGHMSVHSED